MLIQHLRHSHHIDDSANEHSRLAVHLCIRPLSISHISLREPWALSFKYLRVVIPGYVTPFTCLHPAHQILLFPPAFVRASPFLPVPPFHCLCHRHNRRVAELNFRHVSPIRSVIQSTRNLSAPVMSRSPRRQSRTHKPTHVIWSLGGGKRYSTSCESSVLHYRVPYA